MNRILVFAFLLAYNRIKYIYSKTGYFTRLIGCTRMV